MGDWSMAISLSRCSRPSMLSWSPGLPSPPFRSRRRASTRMSLTSELLPEPDTPVTQTNTPSGISTSMFLQVVVPWRRGPPVPLPLAGAAGGGDLDLPACPTDTGPVTLSGCGDDRASGPAATTRPPRTPGPGPKSTMWSAARIVSSSCSTTTTVLPWSRSRARVSSSGRCRGGAGRSKARRGCRARRPGRSRSARPGGCAASRRRKAWGRCGPASGSPGRRS